MFYVLFCGIISEVCVKEHPFIENLTVYLGSDHVILKPTSGIRPKEVLLTTEAGAAVRQACSNCVAGVLNSYRMDLKSVPTADYLIENERVFLRTEKALDALTFTGATFVHRQGA